MTDNDPIIDKLRVQYTEARYPGNLAADIASTPKTSHTWVFRLAAGVLLVGVMIGLAVLLQKPNEAPVAETPPANIDPLEPQIQIVRATSVPSPRSITQPKLPKQPTRPKAIRLPKLPGSPALSFSTPSKKEPTG